MSDQPTITIIRGLPGSGKSLLARKLASESNTIHIEPDMLCQSGGKYNFDQESYAHYEAISQSLIWDICFHTSADVIYCDVLPTRKDVQQVLSNVPDYYAVKVIDMRISPEESLRRNRHNVNKADIARFAESWEDWPTQAE